MVASDTWWRVTRRTVARRAVPRQRLCCVTDRGVYFFAPDAEIAEILSSPR